MKVTNEFNLPQSVLNAVKSDAYHKGDADYSVTGLIDTPRIPALIQKHGDEVSTDASDKIFAALGSALHSILEDGHHFDEVIEERLYATINGVTISGKIDVQHITPDGIIIRDYKVSSVWAYIMGKPDWERQLNCYAHLVEANTPVPVIGLEIVALFRDWRKADSKRKSDYPQAPIMTIPQRLWPRPERQAYLEERIAKHVEATRCLEAGEDPPLCTDEERWIRPQKFAVHKKGAKRAVRLFNTRKAAKDFAAEYKNHTVVERPKEYVRCEEWCPVRDVCNQRKGEQVIDLLEKEARG